MDNKMLICSAAACGGVLYAKGFCKKHYQRVRKHGSADDRKWCHGSIEQRFWHHVNVGPTNECWPWTGNKMGSTEYGCVTYGRRGSKRRLAHRVSYEISNGPITDASKVIMHTCDNPKCVNPHHLVLGSQKDNMTDKMAKGRWRLPADEGART